MVVLFKTKKPDFDSCSFLNPLLSWLVRRKMDQIRWCNAKSKWRGKIVTSLKEDLCRTDFQIERSASWICLPYNLPENECNNVYRFPIRGVKYVWQAVGRKLEQTFRTIKGIIHSTVSPPLRLKCVHYLNGLGIRSSGVDSNA